MKARFNTYDIICSVTELQRLVGLRVNQIYDIDNRTFLFRFQEKDEKVVLLMESGNRFHTTAFEWPKNMAPSGFTMKLRKHLKNKRLEKLEQMGVDRIVHFQFGVGEVAHHVILEMYDKGNIILTDHEMTILYILRPHTEGDSVRFAIREKYPEGRAKGDNLINEELLREALATAKDGDNIKKILIPFYGPSISDHILIKNGLIGYKMPKKVDESQIPIEDESKNEDAAKLNTGKNNKKQKPKKEPKLQVSTKIFDLNRDFKTLMNAVNDAESMFRDGKIHKSTGYIIQKKELKPIDETTSNQSDQYFYHNIEYHPFLYEQHKAHPHKIFESFDSAVDEFYSTLEGQKIDLKTLNQEREALKKLSNVKKDHERRLESLSKTQLFDRKRAELISRNQPLVENAITVIRLAIANQMSWSDIQEYIKQAQDTGDEIASSIRQLKLEINHISLYLTDPYNESEDMKANEAEELDGDIGDMKLEPMTIDIDLGLSAYGNATKYYDMKRMAAKKEQRTIESSTKALKSAERKTQQALKEVRTISNISKARKVYWFEKFYWFISSENYLVIGGRDQQQNELIVKRYMRPTDIYVHAEIQGASSVVIQNPTGADIPPKTLHEAGTMAISYSVAWDAKVVTNAYWVRCDQVSKTAPTGEYLGTGSFMIRGKKNFLPPCQLTLGLSFLFKLEDGSIERHHGERRIRTFDEDDVESRLSSVTIENERLESVAEGDEVFVLSESDDEIVDDIKSVDADINAQQQNDSDDESKFPDTHINIEHNTGRVSLQSDTNIERFKSESEMNTENLSFLGDDQPYIIHAAPPRVKQTKIKKDRDQRKGKKSEQEVDANRQRDEASNKSTNQLKRGQKGKLKKIREKYKDQDEEEKQIRMEILKSAGSGKNDKKKSTIKLVSDDININTAINVNNNKPLSAPVKETNQIENQDEVDDTLPGLTDTDMLNSLTGIPYDDDELLFAIPVIAPYHSLQNYKFKVKLTPGTGRRGKVAKTALMIFLKDKMCTIREKDLIKGVKDETLARNIPGKVKLSAPQLQRVKK